jgi:2-alkenal reductase
MKQKRQFLWVFILFLIPMLACGGSLPDLNSNNPVVQPIITQVVAATTSVNTSFEAATNEEAALIELYQRVNPSVVNITVFATATNEAVLPFSQGSGFVYDTTGTIVTNAHVVHGAEQIEVNFYNGHTAEAELVGFDLNSDLAVLHVNELPEGVAALPLASMEGLAVGQTVVAIGNPFGYEGTLTRGIISGLGRTIPALTIFSIPQSIQTDAAINPGNSGGPLLNMRGEVIGVNAQIVTGDNTEANSGVGFAIPVSIVNRVVPSLVQNGEYIWPWMGVAGGDVTLSLVKAMDLADDKGAYIADVADNGPAEKAGLRGGTSNVTIDGRELTVGGDIVTAIDGQPVNSFDDMLVYVALQTSPGQEVVLTVLRDGELMDITLELEPRPSD